MKMRFYRQPRRFYVGINLHARSLYLCVLDHAPGKKSRSLTRPRCAFFGHVAVRRA
jgi:hypothetical protein